MSYDDGVEQDIRLIEIMKNYGVKGTFNINGRDLLEEEQTYPAGTIGRRMGRRLAYDNNFDFVCGLLIARLTNSRLVC